MGSGVSPGAARAEALRGESPRVVLQDACAPVSPQLVWSWAVVFMIQMNVLGAACAALSKHWLLGPLRRKSRYLGKGWFFTFLFPFEGMTVKRCCHVGMDS